jgi:hypothetical protein
MALDEVGGDALLRALAELAAPVGTDGAGGERACRLARRAVEVLPAASAAVLVRDERGDAAVGAGSDPGALRLAQVELDREPGPGMECLHTNRPVDVDDLAAGSRWPAWTAAALEEGWARVHVLPVRPADVAGAPATPGALVLLGHTSDRMTPEDLARARLMAELTGAGLAVDRELDRCHRMIAQLQQALDSRVLIEQAKGILAERGGLDMTGAFERLRGYARTHRMRLVDVAARVVSGEAADAVLTHTRDLRP